MVKSLGILLTVVIKNSSVLIVTSDILFTTQRDPTHDILPRVRPTRNAITSFA